jgi:hypothetical protein
MYIMVRLQVEPCGLRIIAMHEYKVLHCFLNFLLNNNVVYASPFYYIGNFC